MANLLFHTSDLLNELSALQSLASSFLDRISPYQLHELESDIRGLEARGGRMSLEIPKTRPLKTRVSVGEFEPPNKKSGRRVCGTITGIWDIEVKMHSVSNPTRPNAKPKLTQLIGFTGKASTVFRIMDESTSETVACWKMELGDANAPGCFFHTFASADHSFPVPRHPNLFVTPMAAIGFALGELFQRKWEEALSGATDAPNRWRSIQAKRFLALLRWQTEQVSETTSCPWCSLKLAKPENSIFL